MDFGTWFGPFVLAFVAAALVSLVVGSALTIAVGAVVFLAGFWYSLTAGT